MLDRVHLAIGKGETLTMVGENGSGKSVAAFSVMGILDSTACITRGDVEFEGRALLSASSREMNELLGREIAMIFQSSRSALNPIRKVGHQGEDVLHRHGPVARGDARRRAATTLIRSNCRAVCVSG